MLLNISSLLAQQVWSDHSRLLPDKLRGVPTAILIIHAPTPVYPEPNTDTIDYPGKYIWKHQTTVSSKQDLTVIEAGSYIWVGDKGWIANIHMDNAGFAQRFKCPGGILKKGWSYTFFKNWRYGDVIYAGDALWFVFAKDKRGKLYKGIAVVETEGILKTKNN
ncbi:hypothetical protein [Mucilaginibacter flavus]|uniref:hypothetical protein n=1 Tax=Mucilaginibacter flavus TaxID=931504 RepID=UPI0025B3E6E7|nr:hypothetical protein [Mucilaginibacter flavus]MDN3584645.1 hypothetical protein [Mucilaginibacter flavus]